MASDIISGYNVNKTTGSTSTALSTAPERRDDLASETPYRPLGPSEIHIVEILPGDFDQPIQIVLRTVDLKDEPAYDALSYVWNPTDGMVDTSKVLEPAIIKGSEDFPIHLTANLDAAIRYLRQGKPPPSAIWIDALCINQNLALERSHQVGLMSKIYSSAEQVLIWLGPPRQASAFAFEALSSGKLEVYDIDRFIAAMGFLLRRDWFGRLWIAQELTLSRRNPVVHHGSQIMDWEAFTQAVEVVTRRINGEDRCLHGEYLQNFTTKTIFKRIGDHIPSPPPAVLARAVTVLSLRDMRSAGFKARLGQRMLHTVYLRATDPRDRVYGLLGFSSFHTSSIIPDYKKTFSEVYAEAAAVVIQENFCDYLEFLSRFDLIPSTSRHVSWFTDLQTLALTRRSGPSISPPSSILQASLLKEGILSPIVGFSSDFLRLVTTGRIFGVIEDYAVGGSGPVDG